MKEGKYLSECLNYEEIMPGRLNMVVAKTGQGKTVMASKILPQKLNLTNYSRILFLIDTNMGEDMLLRDNEYFQPWAKNPKENKICVMNYNKLGSLLKEYEIWSNMFDLIIADEFHNLYKYARIELSKAIAPYSNFMSDSISSTALRESNSYRALEAIKQWCNNRDIYIVAMTATPEQFLEKDKEFNELIKIIASCGQLASYEIFEYNTYTNIKDVLINKAIKGEKRLIFAPTVCLAKQFKDLVEENTNRKADILWSLNNKTPMSSEQHKIRQYLIDNERYPDDLDDLFLTEAYSTGWNLSDPRVKTTIIHSGNRIIQKQFSGRNRQDIHKLFIYDSKEAENKKRIERRRSQGFSEDWIIPEKFLNKSLNTEQRKQLIEEINFPKKWTSFKKWIEENKHYMFVKKKINGNEFYTILKKY